MSAPDRLIPTETNPVIDKSLPPTPAPLAAPGSIPAAPSDAHADGLNGNTNGVDGSAPPNAAKVKSGQDEKKALMNRLQPPKGQKPTDLAQQKGDRWAKDPVTGGNVLIRDSTLEGHSSLVCCIYALITNTWCG
jgi:hypothetical protein